MAMSKKQYELLFQLTAQLGPNFSKSFKSASKVMSTLQTDLKNASSKLKDVSAYQKQQNAVAKNKETVNELQAEHQRLVDEIEAAGEATPELTKKLQANEKALQKARDATASSEEKLKELISRKIQRGKSAELIADELEEDLSVILPLYHQLISSSS